ncbi:MAG: hypothetical protein JSV49_03185 [Thermoplasmata archaeon]|nr:MAG: hypothetical protein JSV49_03185 [Thermoplasmata archaeon]
MVGKDLVPSAIDEYIFVNQNKMEKYWNKEEFQTYIDDEDLISFGEFYLKLRGKGKDLVEIGKKLYEKGEKMRLPGFNELNT